MENVNESTGGEVSADTVAIHFLKYYYPLLSKDLNGALACYSEESTVQRFNRPAVTGLRNIRSEISETLAGREFKVRIFKINSLYSLKDSVLIQVGAQFVINGEKKNCVHNFCLVPRGPRRYYIHSDILEYASVLFAEPDSPASEKAAANGNSEPVAPTVVPVPPTEPAEAVSPLKANLSSSSGVKEPPSPALDAIQHHNTPVSSPQKPLIPAEQDSIPQQAARQLLHSQLLTKGPVKNDPPSDLPAPPTAFQQAVPTVQHVPEKNVPRTWAKLVSGEVKSNGLPPPTAPPAQPVPAVDVSVKTRQQNHTTPHNNKENRPQDRPRREPFDRKNSRPFTNHLRKKQSSDKAGEPDGFVRNTFEGADGNGHRPYNNGGNFNRDKQPRRCYNCQEAGHLSRNCPTARA